MDSTFVSMSTARQVLRDVFGFTDLFPTQEAVIQRLLEDEESAAIVLPTGGGKSLCFQLPALCLDGLTLVVSPLIALMKDQVDALRKRGVKAASMDSSLSSEEMMAARDGIRDGSLKILYVAPERLNNEAWVAQMKNVKISLLAVDEAHCISVWGQAFRPDYLKVARFAQEMQVERILALTATAPPAVASDMCQQFNIDEKAGLFMTSPFRPNLNISVEVCTSLPAKMKKLVPMLKARTGPAIAYVTRQADCDIVVAMLKKEGIESSAYHAGMAAEKRKEVQDDWLKAKKGVVVATIAFGMGIDKADVRLVAHIHLPKSLENWSQEIGRAGRDGKPSDCLMLLSEADMPGLEGFARGDTPSLKSTRAWLTEVCNAKPKSDGCIDFSTYDQQKDYDVKQVVINLMFARLELDHGYLRAITPMYAKYDLEFSPQGLSSAKADTSEAAKLIVSKWTVGKKYHGINVPDAARNAPGQRREDLVATIARWENLKYVKSKPALVRARFRVIKPLPKSPTEINSLAGTLHDQLEAKEDEEVERLRSVVKVATASECFWQAICTYFGHPDSVPDGKCGTCSFCKTGKAVSLPNSSQSANGLDTSKLDAALAACPVRDDPRFLARFVFGITSPRLTQLGFSKHALFGSMATDDFKAILEYCDKACKKAGYQNGELPEKKRAFTGGSGGGSAPKRGRK